MSHRDGLRQKLRNCVHICKSCAEKNRGFFFSGHVRVFVIFMHIVDDTVQGAAKKVIPCRIFQIFKQPLLIFC